MRARQLQLHEITRRWLLRVCDTRDYCHGGQRNPRNDEQILFPWKMGARTLSLFDDDASNKTFGKNNKHKVFIIEKIQQDLGMNISTRLVVDGIIGLAKNS